MVAPTRSAIVSSSQRPPHSSQFLVSRWAGPYFAQYAVAASAHPLRALICCAIRRQPACYVKAYHCLPLVRSYAMHRSRQPPCTQKWTLICSKRLPCLGRRCSHVDQHCKDTSLCVGHLGL